MQMSNDKLFKLTMINQYGFETNTDFDKLKRYIKFLYKNDKAMNINEISNKLDISSSTIKRYNKLLYNNEIPLINIPYDSLVKAVKDMNGKEHILDVDDYEGWRTNFNYIFATLKHKLNSSKKDNVVIFERGDKYNYYISNEASVKAMDKSFKIHNNNGTINNFIYKYFRQWSIESFGYKCMYTKYKYHLNLDNVSNDFINLCSSNKIELLFDFIDNNVNVLLRKEQIEHAINNLDIRDKRRHLFTVSKVIKVIEAKGYVVTKKRIRDNGERVTCWIINK